MRGTTIRNIFVSRRVRCQLSVSREQNGGAASLVLPGDVSPSRGVLRARAVRMRLARIGVHDPPRRAVTAHNAPKEHRAAIARNTVVVPCHIAVDPAPHKSPSSDHRWPPVARAMPCARAVALPEIVRRIAYEQLRRKTQMRDRAFELASELTLLKPCFTIRLRGWCRVGATAAGEVNAMSGLRGKLEAW